MSLLSSDWSSAFRFLTLLPADSSRKGTLETATHLVNAAAAATRGGNPVSTLYGQQQQQQRLSPYVRDRAHQERLAVAARQVQNGKLAEVMAAGGEWAPP